MGIIAKQTLKGSALTYAGIGIGFLTAGILFPKFLSKEQVGVINLLLRYAVLFSFFSDLGFNAITLKLFPHFRNKDKGHNGFLPLKLIINAGGFILFALLFYSFQNEFIARNIEKSPLFVEYLYLLVPYVGIFLLYNALDTYNQVLYNATQGTFLKEFVQRIFILIPLIFFISEWLNFSQFIYAYTFALIVPIFGLIFYLNRRKEIHLSISNTSIIKLQKKEMINVGFFGIIAGIAPILVTTLDTIMVNDFLGEAETGIYGTMILFTTVILVPSKALSRISTPILADAWKENDTEKINNIHKRSGVNQLLFGGLVFIGIWANMDNVFHIIPESFSSGKNIVFYLGIGSLVTMATGVNQLILVTSKYYKFQTLFVIIFSITVVVSNNILIPQEGIIGAAIASLIAITLNAILRGIFVWKTLKTQPLSSKTLILVGIISVTFFLQSLLPPQQFILDIIIRSTLITMIFVSLCYSLKISKDLNRLVKKAFSLVKKS